MKEFVTKICREKFNGNRSEMARYFGFTPQNVSQWMKGRAEPSDENLKKLCEFSGKSFEEVKQGLGRIKFVNRKPSIEGMIEAKLAEQAARSLGLSKELTIYEKRCLYLLSKMDSTSQRMAFSIMSSISEKIIDDGVAVVRECMAIYPDSNDHLLPTEIS